MSSKNVVKKKTRQVVKTGDVIAIPLPDGRYAFGLQIGDDTAIYSVVADSPDKPPIGHRKFLFAVCVYGDVLSSMRWPRVGKDTVGQSEVDFMNIGYLHHPGERVVFELYSPRFENYMKPSTKAECLGLERVAVWDWGNIVQRILSSLKGERSEWLEDDPWLPFAIDLSHPNNFRRVPLSEVLV